LSDVIKYRIRLESLVPGVNGCVIYPYLNDTRNGLLQYPIDLTKWRILSIDKYGKDIYENDDVLHDDGRVGRVVYNPDNYAFDISNNLYVSDQEQGIESSKMKVIGNAYGI
jgi:hypothetical protein